MRVRSSPRLRHLPCLLVALLCLFNAVIPLSPAKAEAQPSVRRDLWGTDGSTYATAISGNTLYVGGQFSMVGPSTGSFVSLDQAKGEHDPAFPRVTGRVNAIAADGVGGWYIGGVFTAVDGIPRANLAHIRADKTLDPAWAPLVARGSNPLSGHLAQVNALTVVENRVLVGGCFDYINGVLRRNVAAVSVDGTGEATAWQADTSSEEDSPCVNALASGAGMLFIGGEFDKVGGVTRNRLAAVSLADGTVAPAWKPEPDNWVLSLSVHNNMLYVGGRFTFIGGQPRKHLVALSTTGAGVADPRWKPDPDDQVDALLTGGDTLYVGGAFTKIGGLPRTGLAAVDLASRAVDPQWNISLAYGQSHGAPMGVRALALSGATLYFAGDFLSVNSEPRDGLAAVGVEGAGKINADWNPRPSGQIFALGVSDKAIYAGGFFPIINSVRRSNIAAFDLTTGKVTDWNPQIYGGVMTILPRGDRVYVGGFFEQVNGKPLKNLAALQASSIGDLVADWALNSTSSEFSGTVDTLVIANETLYVGGAFSSIGRVSRGGLAAVSLTNGAVTDWDLQLKGYFTGSPSVKTLLAQDGALYVGGRYKTIGGQERNGLAKVNLASGVVDPNWNPDPGSGASWADPPGIRTLALHNDTLFIGGLFNYVGGLLCPHLAAVSASGTGAPNATWNSQVDHEVTALAASDDSLFVGGSFSNIGGQSQRRLASLRYDTGQATPWNPLVVDLEYPDNSWSDVESLSIHGTTLYVAGYFNQVNGEPTPNLAGIDIDSKDQLFLPFVGKD